MVKIVYVDNEIKYINVNQNEKEFNKKIAILMLKECNKDFSYTQFVYRYIKNIEELIRNSNIVFFEKKFTIIKYQEDKIIEKKWETKYKKLNFKKY